MFWHPISAPAPSMLAVDAVRSSLVNPATARSSSGGGAAVAAAAAAITRDTGRCDESLRRMGRTVADVKCTAQGVDVPPSASGKVSLSLKQVERSSRDELVVLSPPETVAKVSGLRFESAAQQLEISLQQLRILPKELEWPLEDGDAEEPSSSGETSDGHGRPLPEPRKKKIWQGVRRQKRTPPQAPWTADDFTRKTNLVMESILSESGEDRGLVVEDILDSWLGKVTRVELTRVIKDLGFRRRPSLALEVFCWMEKQKGRLKPTPHVYSAVIGMLGRAGMISKAREIFDSRQLKSLESVHVYNSMMGAYVKCRNFKRAWKLYEDLCDNGLDADEVTFNTLLSGISLAERPLKTAEKLFSKMKRVGISPGTYTYNTLMMVFSKCGHLDGAASLLEEMRSANKTPDLCTFNTVISMYGRAGKYEEALQVLSSLRAAGFDPDIVTYTYLMQMCSRAQNLEAGLSHFSEMQRVGCMPDLMTYSLVVHMYGRAGLPAEAERAFEKMQEAGFKPNIVTWSSLIQAYGQKGMLEKVGSCFAEMQNSGCQPDASLYNIMMTAYKKAELPIHAASLFRRMQSQGIEANASSYNTMIHAFSRSGQREDAKALHEEMMRAGYSPDKLSRRYLNHLSSNRGKQGNHPRFQTIHSAQSLSSPPR